MCVVALSLPTVPHHAVVRVIHHGRDQVLVPLTAWLPVIIRSAAPT